MSIKGIELLEELKNEAEVKKEGKDIKLIFKNPIKISETEESREFTFLIPTLNDIEYALDAVENISSETLKNLKQSYYLISSQFAPHIAPNDVPKYIRGDELKAFTDVLSHFL